MLERPLLARGQQVEPRCDRRLHGVGEVIGRAAAALGDRLGDLLGEERVAAGCLGDAPGERAVLRRAAERPPAGRRPPRVSGRSSIWVTFRAERPKSGRRSRSSGPARAQHHERHVVEPEDNLLDQVEQAVVGPVRVVDPDHQRPLAREQGDEAPPRLLELVLDVAVARLRRRARSRASGRARRRPLRRGSRRRSAERVVDACRPSRRRRLRPRHAGSRRAPRTRSRARTAGFGRGGSPEPGRPRARRSVSSLARRVLPTPASPVIVTSSGTRSRAARR